jgi:hypothetical protein
MTLVTLQVQPDMEELTENAEDGADEESKQSEVKLGKLQYKVSINCWSDKLINPSLTSKRAEGDFDFKLLRFRASRLLGMQPARHARRAGCILLISQAFSPLSHSKAQTNDDNVFSAGVRLQYQ